MFDWVVVVAQSDGSDSAALPVAIIALIASIAAAAISLYGVQRTGERAFQKERRDLYSDYNTAVSVLIHPGESERPPSSDDLAKAAQYRTLFERVQQLAWPELINVLRQEGLTEIPPTIGQSVNMDRVRAWQRYDVRPYVFHWPLVRLLRKPPDEEGVSR